MSYHFLLGGDLPDPGIEIPSLMSPGMAGGFFTKTPSGKPGHHDNICIKHQGSFPLGYLELHSFFFLEEEMATHSSILAWRIPGTGEPGRLLSMGLHRVGHD